MVCLSYGEKSGKGAGLTLNFAVTDVRDRLKIKNWLKNLTNLWTFGLNYLNNEISIPE